MEFGFICLCLFLDFDGLKAVKLFEHIVAAEVAMKDFSVLGDFFGRTALEGATCEVFNSCDSSMEATG
jgi:hypothetical protein